MPLDTGGTVVDGTGVGGVCVTAGVAVGRDLDPGVAVGCAACAGAVAFFAATDGVVVNG